MPFALPLWLSCYINGCEERWHADRPHGPWAFVLSLSPEDIQFSGGETMLLKPAVLNFWNSVSHLGNQSFEENDVVERVTPTFNRLTVFDPRIPHGVSPSGNDEPTRRPTGVAWMVYSAAPSL